MIFNLFLEVAGDESLFIDTEKLVFLRAMFILILPWLWCYFIIQF